MWNIITSISARNQIKIWFQLLARDTSFCTLISLPFSLYPRLLSILLSPFSSPSFFSFSFSFLFSFSSTDEQLQEMTSPANYNRYKEISRPNVDKIVSLGMAFRNTYGRYFWCVRTELGKGGVRERRGMVREEKVEGWWWGDEMITEWGMEEESVEGGGRSDGLRHMRE